MGKLAGKGAGIEKLALMSNNKKDSGKMVLITIVGLSLDQR